MIRTSIRSGLLALIAGVAFIGIPHPAQAIPVFANGQGGVSCKLCHTSVPNLNPTGRYILATNFARVLDAHSQMMENRKMPIALLVTANASSIPNPNFNSKIVANVVDFLSGGYFGKDVTYYASVPVEEGGFPATGVDQVWVAYNGFSHHNGSLQVGYFPTPFFAPWVSQPVTLSGYGFAGLPVGLNSNTVGANRWGASYTQMGSKGLIGNVAIMSNSGPLEQAYDNEFDSGGQGTALLASVQYLNPSSRWSGGLSGMSGGYPLPSGAKDRYSRTGALIAYTRSKYSIMATGLRGYDSNPNDGATDASTSSGFSLESIFMPMKWLTLSGRYDTINDGLGSFSQAYVTDATFNLRPNIVLTVENVSNVNGTPVVNYQLLWAGPWYRQR